MEYRLVIATIVLCLLFPPLLSPLVVSAQSSPDINIVQLTLSSYSGVAGSTVSVVGSISTLNGSYHVILGNTIVYSGVSEGYNVEANFTVPEVPAARYALALRDISTNVQASKEFTVMIGYAVTSNPIIVQEGNPVSLNVAVTGGSLGTSYGAHIEVTVPTGATYTVDVDLGTPDVKGTAQKELLFPSNTFSPSGAVTDYVGPYKVAFNGTLATDTFFVNILDLPSYHRGETATLRAIGYQPYQTATITINSVSGELLWSKSVLASSGGVIGIRWVVPTTISIGNYIARIVPEGQQKPIQDQQTFTIPGYNVAVQASSLSNRPVADIVIQALDSATKKLSNSTTDINGLTNFKLEKGPHTLTAYLDEITIGTADITVTGNGTFNLVCKLNDLKVTVQTVDGIGLPFVNLDIKYNYQSGSISKNGSVSGQTDPSGNYFLVSTFIGATYTIDASMYNQRFNTLNNTVNNLPNQAIVEVTIICPTRTVNFTVTGYNHEAISKARLEFVEISNGLFHSVTTDNDGLVETQITFGKYRVRVYTDNALINELDIQVFSDVQKQINCNLYGIKLTVLVVDFFGTPINSATVNLNGPTKASAMTQSDGVAVFENVIGGDLQIIAQAQGVPDASQTLIANVQEPTTIQVKIDKYVTIGGSLIQASAYITIVMLIAIIAVFCIIDFFMHRKMKSSSELSA